MEISKEALTNFVTKMIAEKAEKTAVEKTVIEKQAKKLPQDPVLINTEHGAVVVFGHELISKKELGILGYCLNMPYFSADEPDHGVRVVTFRDDNRPKGPCGKAILANCTPDIGGIVINLQHTFTIAVEEAIDQPELSIHAAYHRNMIVNYLHEISHLNVMKDGVPIDDDEKDDLETAAEEWALEQLYVLAKTVDIEPEHPAHSTFLSAQLMDLLKDDDSDWAKDQRYCLENHIMWKLDETKEAERLTLMSFKSLCHLMSGDAVDAPEWVTPTLPNPVMELEIEKAVKHLDPDAINANTMATPVAEVSSNTMGLNPLPPDIFASMGAETMDVEEPYDPNMADHGFNEDEEIGFGGGDYIKQVNVEFDGGSTQPESSPVVEGPAVKTHPETGLTPEQTGVIARGVYFKCYTHIFSQCQRELYSDVGFKYPEGVSVTPIPLTDIEKTVVVKMDCLDENGKWQEGTTTANGIRGSIMKNTKLPTYMLYINNNGVEEARMLLPQNPAIKVNGVYKKTALKARGGTEIMYVMEGNDEIVKADPKQKFKMKIIDKVFTK